MLKAPRPIEYFKASEVGDREKGPFRDFTGQDQQHKVNALVDVLYTSHPLALSVSLEWKVFENFRSSNRLLPVGRDPYFFLYYGMIALAARCAAGEASPTPMPWTIAAAPTASHTLAHPRIPSRTNGMPSSTGPVHCLQRRRISYNRY